MKVIALVFLLTILPAVVMAQSERQIAKIRADIIAVMDAQTAAWNRGDIDGFMRGYWNSEKLVFASGDAVTRGWQPTLDRYKKSYNSKEKMGALRFSDIEINVISKDAAVVLGSWSLTRASDNPKGKFTLIFRKFGDQWRIVHDHTS
ncbi:MAG TPA: nuclear transport factor 2 family protein [Pyrinomonadaceae bacterium]